MSSIVQAHLVGGIGNQLHQYAAVRKYAETHGATLEVADWIGRKLFGLPDPDWSCELPVVNDGAAGTPPEVVAGQVNIRLTGYFQSQRWVGTLSCAEVKRWFTIQPQWLAACGDRPLPWYAAAHLRRGDYIDNPCYCNVTEASYLQACAEHDIPTDKLVWVRQDQPRTAALPRGLEFLPDFVTLLRADVILRANSTFSWWAAALSNADVYAPVVDDLVGEHTVPFIRGNHPRCAHPDRVGPLITDLHLPP